MEDNQLDRPSRFAEARRLAEKALQADADGDSDTADRLFDQAQRISPEAVTAFLEEHENDPPRRRAPPAASDAEVAAETEMAHPEAHAPSRANITGPGSGADAQK